MGPQEVLKASIPDRGRARTLTSGEVLVHDKGNLRFSRDKVQIVSIIEEAACLASRPLGGGGRNPRPGSAAQSAFARRRTWGVLLDGCGLQCGTHSLPGRVFVDQHRARLHRCWPVSGPAGWILTQAR